jgi:hypothetical protein
MVVFATGLAIKYLMCWSNPAPTQCGAFAAMQAVLAGLRALEGSFQATQLRLSVGAIDPQKS